MNLGEWLDEVVAERAAEQGDDPQDYDRDERLDAIGERLARLSHRPEPASERFGRRQYRDAPIDGPPSRASARKAPQMDSRHADDMLSEAIDRLEQRLAKSDQRATRALESVADWMEHSQSGRVDEHKTLETVVDKLDGIEARLAEQQRKIVQQEKLRSREELESREAAPKREAALAKRLEQTTRNLDQRMQDLTDRIASADQRKLRERQALEAAPKPEAILAQQLEATARKLDQRMQDLSERMSVADQPKPQEPPTRERLNLADAVTRIVQRQKELGGRPSVRAEAPPPPSGWRNFGVDLAPAQAPPPVPAAPADSPAAASGLTAELQRLNQRLDALRADEAAHRVVPPLDISGLRDELAAMSRSLSDLAPKNAVVALEGAVQDLSSRILAIRESGGRDMALAPLEALVADIRQSLRSHDPKEASKNLEREIRAIGAKVDGIAHSAIDPQAFERIRQQTEEVRNLLAAAAQRPVPVDRLEKQIGDLADRIEAISASPSPNTDSADVLVRLADVRAQVERSTPASALISIERRLERLAARIDQAIERPQPAPVIEVPGLDDLKRRIDSMREAVERRPAPVLQVPGLEDLSRRIEGMREAVERRPAPVLQVPGLEDLSRRIEGMREAVERRPAQSVDLKPLEQMLRALGERQANVDTSPLERLVSKLDAKLAIKPPQSGATPELESLIRGINEKLDRSSAAPNLEPLIQEIHNKLDRSNAPNFDPRSLEAMFQDLGERIDRRATPVIDTRGLEQTLRDLTAKFEAKPSADLNEALIERAVATLTQRLDARGAPNLDTNAIIREIAGLHDRFDHMQAGSSVSKAIEPMFADILAELGNMRDAARLAPTFSGDPESHGGSAAAFDAIAREIAAVRDRLDQLQAGPGAQASLEPLISHVLTELEQMRGAVQTGMSGQPAASADAPEFARGLADLRAEQADSDRAMQAKLSGVHGLLETIVDRVTQMEDDVNSAAPIAPPLRPAAAAPKRPYDDELEPLNSSTPAPTAMKLAGAAIPDRASFGRPFAAEKAALRSLDGSDFLIEPGAAALARPDFAEDKSPKAINAHIAAARRAAQNAISASAASAGGNGLTRPRAEDAGAESVGGNGLARAKNFVLNRKRPILLGLALFVVVTLAVAQLAGSRQSLPQKSEIAPIAPASLAAAEPAADTTPAKSEARALDATPVGSINAASPVPAPAAPPAAASAGDLAASIPQGVPAALREAAAKGDSGAEYELALRFVEGRGVTRDPKLAAQWMQSAADQGLPPAQYRLASFYEKGIGVTRDLAQAKALYVKAADAGNARAMHNLAVLAAESVGIKPDYVEAASWFRKAGALGVKDSQYNLGILYARGMGVAQDLAQSWLWFSLAAQQGDADAAKKRDEVAAKMDAKALAAAPATLAAFKISTPPPAANEVAPPAGGWDAGKAAPQAYQLPPAARPPLGLSPHSRHGVTL